MKRALALIGIGALLMTGAPLEAPAIPTDTEVLICGEVTSSPLPDIPVGTAVSLLFFLNTLATQSPAGSGSYSGTQRLGSVRIVGTAISAEIDTIDQLATTWDATSTLDPIPVGEPPVLLGGTVDINFTGTGNDINVIEFTFDPGSAGGTASVNVEIPNDPDPPIVLPIVATMSDTGDACPVAIPATPPWGLWLLAALLLGGVGAFMLRRHGAQPAA